MLGTLFMYLFNKNESDAKDEEILKRLPCVKPFLSQSFRECMLNVFHPFTPFIFGLSSSLDNVWSDWSEDVKQRVKFTGSWVVPKEQQKDRLKRRDSLFGGAAMSELTD